MKTVKDLRDLVQANDGQINIGGLVIATNKDERTDINIRWKGKLLTWVRGIELDGCDLSNVDTKLTDDFIVDKTTEVSLGSEITRLKENLNGIAKENSRLLEMVKQNDLAVGKVEAYEKLLIGREISIGK